MQPNGLQNLNQLSALNAAAYRLPTGLSAAQLQQLQMSGLQVKQSNNRPDQSNI